MEHTKLIQGGGRGRDKPGKSVTSEQHNVCYSNAIALLYEGKPSINPNPDLTNASIATYLKNI
jgi:hypothetical protein